MIVQNAKAADPHTSQLAGQQVEANGTAGEQRQHCLELVKSNPGRTSAELAAVSDTLDRYQVARRLSEIRGITQGESRRCHQSGRQAVTWWPL